MIELSLNQSLLQKILEKIKPESDSARGIPDCPKCGSGNLAGWSLNGRMALMCLNCGYGGNQDCHHRYFP